MAGARKRHTADFKSKVAIDAIRQHQTTNEQTTKHGVHATQVNTRKKQALAAIPTAFKGKREHKADIPHSFPIIYEYILS